MKRAGMKAINLLEQRVYNETSFDGNSKTVGTCSFTMMVD